jgi:hypothetical protein
LWGWTQTSRLIARPLLFLACLLGATGCEDHDSGRDAEPLALETERDALQAGAVVLNVAKALSPDQAGLIPFGDLIPFGGVEEGEPTVEDCEISGKLSFVESSRERPFDLFEQVQLATDEVSTHYFSCRSDYVDVAGTSGVLTLDGTLETASATDAEGNGYVYLKAGQNDDPERDFQAGFLRNTINDPVFQNATLRARGTLESASLADRLESRTKRFTLSFGLNGGGRTRLLKTDLGEPASALIVAQLDDGTSRISGPLRYRSELGTCKGGRVDVVTVSPLVFDDVVVGGEIRLIAGDQVASLRFQSAGAVDVQLNGGRSLRYSPEEFQAARLDPGC